MNARSRLGQLGEEIAVRHLSDAGMTILARNWRCAEQELRGELDVVAWDDGALVVCEVKARRNNAAGGPLTAVTPAKYHQLRRLAAAYLAETGHVADEVRFDLVGVLWRPDGDSPRVEHLRGVG